MRMKSLFLVLSIVTLNACGGGSSSRAAPAAAALPAVTSSDFVIEVVNLTNAQPLSPVSLIAHDGTYRVFSLGQAAGTGLEEMAEGGDNTGLLDEATALDGVIFARSGEGAVPPGGSTMFEARFNTPTLDSLHVSIASMLVNTNDAFTAVNSVDLSALAAGETITLDSIVYDAGTELDSEGAGTIPGPAVGGEGFNALRDDEADRVSMHPGVLSAMDGLATSVLTEQHRFDNPAARISITRLN